MIATIHQPQYLPWLGYFHKAYVADIFILLDNVQYKKNDWQNRNRIRTAHEWQWLTIPIINNFGQKIIDVQIDNNKDWCRTHLNAVKMNYSKAKYFNQYFEFFEEVYSKHWEFLVDINIAFIQQLLVWMGIETQIVRASEHNTLSENPTLRLVDLCKEYDADIYLSGIDGEKYMDYQFFENQGIEIEVQDFNHPIYSQLWCNGNNKNFISHMSIIDLLFNEGQKSLGILTGKD